MRLTRRQLLKRGMLLGMAAPLSVGAAWAGQGGGAAGLRHGEIHLYGVGRSITELGLGLRQQGWAPRYAGRLDPVPLSALPADTLAAGFTDDAGLVLLTSLLAGSGRILALGRHEAENHHLLSHRGPVVAPLAVTSGSWQTALGEEYARLAAAGSDERHARQFRRPAEAAALHAHELSFLIRL